MNDEEMSQIVSELTKIRKEITSIKNGMSGSVALGIIGASIITALFYAVMQVAFRR